MRGFVAVAVSLSLPLLLTGCALNTTAAPDLATGAQLQGIVHGGQQPIVGSHIYLLAANTTGYGNASLSLLTAGSGRTQDTSGRATNGFYYVTTASDGSFSITGDYSCTPTTQVYAYALGGNPGAGTNAAAGLMAALGNCPGAGNFATTAPFIWINEVSTVAAAYAIAGFATDALHVSSSGTATAKLGIANAFLNAQVLETLSTGVANQAPPALAGGVSESSVPQSEINTLGNILAACVNSTGALTGPSTPSTCYTLFTNAMSAGTTGTQPTDTATAAINIAHNPVAAVGALYGLSSASTQFNPVLSAQPNDFTVSIFYNNNFVNDGGPLAIDAAGDVWVAAGSMTALNGQGYDFTGGNGFSGVSGYHVAIDINGGAWVLGASTVAKVNTAGTVTGPYSSGLGLTNPTPIMPWARPPIAWIWG